jgi:F0F1-type ATP synthase delta subunit
MEKLLAHLKSSGRTKLLPGILRELKVLETRTESGATHLEVASEKEEARARTALHKEGIVPTHVTIQPNLVSGWRARSKNALVDCSGKRGLIDLYRTVTH